MKSLTWEELLALFDNDVHNRLEGLRQRTGITHLVVFENPQLDSSAMGARTAVTIGPDCTYRSLEEAAGSWLNDLPSQRQYPCAYYTMENHETCRT